MEQRDAIMIIDDSMSSVMLTKAMINNSFPQLETIIAFSGRQAIEMIERGHNNFVCALIDYHMNELNGHEVMKRLSSEIPYSKMALLTSETNSDIITKTKKLGARYLTKPLKVEDLQDFIMMEPDYS